MPKIIKLFLISILATAAAAPAFSQTDEVPEDIVSLKAERVEFVGTEKDIKFQVLVKEGFFAYLDKFSLEIDGREAENLSFDPVVTFFDKTFNKNKRGIKNSALGSAQLASATSYKAGDTISIKLGYQACTVEYCLFPTKVTYKQILSKEEARALSRLSSPDWLKGGLFYALLFIFFTGLLTSLTPCVYPLIPITLAVLGREKSDTKLNGFIKSSTYVLGMALTYALLGMLAATSGFMFGSLLSNIYFISILCFILFLAALSMLDVFEIKSPAFFNNFGSGKKKSLSGIFISGAFSGLVVGPCVGPVLVGILSYVSSSGDLFKGFLLLFVFALGLGSLIIVLGTFSNLIDRLPKSGGWMVWVKKVLGLVFVLMMGYFLKPILETQVFFIVMASVFMGLSSIMLWHYKKIGYASSMEKALFRTLLICSVLAGSSVYFMSSERFERLVGYNSSTYLNTHWDVFSEEKLTLAKKNGNVVILDFYADWCAACKELKHITFADKRVLDYSAKIKWLYFDATKPSETLTEYKEKYQIMGLPTILFFDTDGELKKNMTLTGFEGPDKFLERLKKLNIKNDNGDRNE
ncbi:MAG: cytochrome c biogenesis protein CcdA [Bdellovibrionales bacterium]